jgi:N-acetylglucosaminyl-diphospho-decaprenol L-rhamnosyltransferase
VTAPPPRVDVGVVTWNTRDVTVRALRALLDSDQGVDIRLMVRDNASSDGTAEAISRAIPEAVVEAGTENLGFARGVNRLLASSDAPWFLTLNSDAWPEDGAIGRLVAAAEKDARIAAAAPLVLRPDGELEPTIHPFPSPAQSLRMAAHGSSAADHTTARRIDWAHGAALLFRRTAVDQLGGLDERLFMYAEDFEWCWRATRSGWMVWFEPAAVIRHVGNASAEQNYGELRLAAQWRNNYRVYRWHRGALPTTALRAANITRAGIEIARASARRKPGVRRYWRNQLRMHLVSTRQPDGPPTAS